MFFASCSRKEIWTNGQDYKLVGYLGNVIVLEQMLSKEEAEGYAERLKLDIINKGF